MSPGGSAIGGPWPGGMLVNRRVRMTVSELEIITHWASQVALVVKNPPANTGDARDVGSIPGLGRPLEKEIATHFNILAWKTPWTEEPD